LGFPNSNGGTIEISQNKKGGPMVSQELSKSDIVKIIEQLDKLLPSNFVSKQRRGRRKTYSDKSILKLSI